MQGMDMHHKAIQVWVRADKKKSLAPRAGSSMEIFVQISSIINTPGYVERLSITASWLIRFFMFKVM